MNSPRIVVVFAALTVLCSMPALAQGEWELEITPYIWFAGIDGDMTVDDQTVEMDLDFGDLFDAVDFGVSTIIEARNDVWFVGGQFDYLALDTDNVSGSPDAVSVDIDITMFTLGGGYTFELPWQGATLGVGPGVRFMNMDMEQTLRTPMGTVKPDDNTDVVDVLVILRPSIPINEKLRINPAITLGAGDSDFTYDLWPNLQYVFNDSWHCRVGYRNLYYDYKDGASGFDGNISGFFVGAGAHF